MNALVQNAALRSSLPALAGLFALGWRQALSQRLVMAGKLATYIMILSVFAAIWRMTPFGEFSNGTLSYTKMVWYVTVTELIIFSSAFFFKDIVNDVDGGQLGAYFSRPVPYLLQRVAEWAGQALAQTLVFIIGGFSLAFWLTGVFPWDAAGFVLMLLAMLLAVFTALLTHFSIGAMQLWSRAASPFYWLWQKALFVLGGLILPLGMYPQIMQDIAWVTPFPAILAVPGNTVLGQTGGLFLLFQLFWLAVAAMVAWLNNAAMVRRVGREGE